MRILTILTYYRPHISGLTIYAERLAVALAKRGHQVTVLTAQIKPDLPLEEVMEGVRVVRVPVLFKLSKGFIMPGFGATARRLIRENDVVLLHLPQFEAAQPALIAKRMHKPVVITYHCDLQMPRGVVSQAANLGVNLMNGIAGRAANRMVTYTRDYADHSKYLLRFPQKVEIIPPPVVLPSATAEEIKTFDLAHNPEQRKPVIGMVARFASEKGVEILLNALPIILEKYPSAVVEFVGPYQNITGEERYFARLKPQLDRYIKSGNWHFTGSLSPKELAAYYPNLDVHVLPSLNSTEAFGLVQIESMMNGVPCVTSNLPGVRQPVKVHGMGRIFEIGDSSGLANAVIEVLSHHDEYSITHPQEFERYNPHATAEAYEQLFARIQSETH
ncbi:MAG: glycosyltransferase family 4 protein [Anaerolineaceae bacterium]